MVRVDAFLLYAILSFYFTTYLFICIYRYL